jgi:hypothetical protein
VFEASLKSNFSVPDILREKKRQFGLVSLEKTNRLDFRRLHKVIPGALIPCHKSITQ